jgi:hypothetical protein
MKTITFISHYNGTELNVRLTDEKADKLLNNKNYAPIELYRHDHDRVSAGEEPHYLSKGQVKKLDNYLNGIEYWDAVVAGE